MSALATAQAKKRIIKVKKQKKPELTKKKDGLKEHDDRGFVCYWDAEEEGWICDEESASERFMKLLKSLDTFEGFDDGANDDTDSEDEKEDEEKPKKLLSKKLLRVTYGTPESIFAIPIGLDLHDKTIVEGWGVKWDTLYIDFADGTNLEIKPKISALDFDDIKYPMDEQIEDNNDQLDDYDFKTIEALLALAKN